MSQNSDHQRLSLGGSDCPLQPKQPTALRNTSQGEKNDDDDDDENYSGTSKNSQTYPLLHQKQNHEDLERSQYRSGHGITARLRPKSFLILLIISCIINIVLLACQIPLRRTPSHERSKYGLSSSFNI